MDTELKDTLLLFEDQLKDLEKWSVYHEDQYNETIGEIRDLYKKLKGEIYGK